MKKHTVAENTRIFVVEDDPMYLRMVKYVMEMNPDHEVHCFASGRECLQNLHRRPDIVSIDFSLPDMDGEQLFQQLRKSLPDAGFIMLSGQQDVKTAVRLLREGVHDYITKDAETKERLRHAVENLKTQLSLRAEVEELKTQLVEQNQFQKLMIGESPAILEVSRMLEKAARTDITVSITGETGAGKELAARAVHFNSARAKQPFVAVNMSAIPKDLLESELFGYEKGAFTGALARKRGHFELADKGTLFLDEIGDLDLAMQSKLLRAIQEREFVRVGGEQVVKFDARIIVATHKDLRREVMEGRFREDLYYRLLGFPVKMPRLRERENDVLLLAQHFIEVFAKQNRLGKIKLSRPAKDKLLGYNFPGNVRELKAVVELAAALCNDGQIEAEDIRFSGVRAANVPSNGIVLEENLTLEQMKNQIMRTVLERCNGDVMEAARRLDIGKSTIYRMLQEAEA